MARREEDWGTDGVVTMEGARGGEELEIGGEAGGVVELWMGRSGRSPLVAFL